MFWITDALDDVRLRLRRRIGRILLRPKDDETTTMDDDDDDEEEGIKIPPDAEESIVFLSLSLSLCLFPFELEKGKRLRLSLCQSALFYDAFPLI